MASSIEFEDFHLPDYSPPPGYKSRATTPQGIAAIDGPSDSAAVESRLDTTPTRPSPLRRVTTHSQNGTASSSSPSGNAEFSNTLFVVLMLNIPFAIMFMVDMVGTFHPQSTFYRKNLYLKATGGLVFHALYVPLGVVTMLVDLAFLWSAVRGIIKSHVKDWPTWKLFVVVVAAGVLGGLVAISPGVYPVVAMFVHNQTHYDVVIASGCRESGFGSIIQLHTAAGGAGSNATFLTASGALDFTMKLLKTESGLDSFALDPSPSHNFTFAGVSVDFNLSAHTYDFRLHDASLPENQSILRHGLIFDDPSGTLSFPDLHWPLHTTTSTTWSIASGKLPVFQLVDAAAPPNTVLKAVAFDGGCELRMTACGMWTTGEIEADWRKFESVAVSVGRMLIEVGKVGAGCIVRSHRRGA